MSPPNRQPGFLDYGDVAVNNPLDAILDNRAAADPLKRGGDEKQEVLKKCRKKAAGKTLVIVAGGWNYNSTQDEIDAINNGPWRPTTADFFAAGGAGALSANNAKGFLQLIANQSFDSVGRVVFIGHGGLGGIKFSGDASTGAGSESMDTGDLATFSDFIKNNVVPNLHRNAKIELITCLNGADQLFMDAMANAFDRCVKGFNSLIEFRIPDVSDSKISGRGYTRVGGAGKFKKGWRHLRFEICVCT